MIYTFPEGYGEGCYLVPIDKRLIPLVAGALRIFEQERSWASREDYEQGYNAFAELQVCMTLICAKHFIEAQNRVYRLIDTTFNGAEYSADIIDGETVVTPLIPDAPAAVTRSIHSRLERLEYIIDNFYNGGIYSPDFENPISVRQQLTDLTTAIEATGQLDDDVLAKLAEIALVLA